MTRGMDNDEWLKRIGAVAVDEDEDELAGDPTADEDHEPAVPGDDFADGGEAQLGHGEYGIAEEAPLGTDVDYGTAGEAPFGPGDDYEDDEDQRHNLLLDPAVGGVRPVANLPLDSGGTTGPVDAAPRRFTPWVLAAFGAAAVIGTIITLVVTMANSPGSESAAPSAAPVAPRVVEVAPPSAPPNADGPLPFTASSDCPPGSTAAQTVADPNSTTPWVCVRSVDGQVLEIDLGRTFVITAVSIVPGAVNKTATAPE